MKPDRFVCLQSSAITKIVSFKKLSAHHRSCQAITPAIKSKMNRLSPGFSTKSTANVADTINSECPSSVGAQRRITGRAKKTVHSFSAQRSYSGIYTNLRKAPTRLGLSMIQPVSSITSRCKAGIGCSPGSMPPPGS